MENSRPVDLGTVSFDPPTARKGSSLHAIAANNRARTLMRLDSKNWKESVALSTSFHVLTEVVNFLVNPSTAELTFASIAQQKEVLAELQSKKESRGLILIRNRIFTVSGSSSDQSEAD